MATNDHTDSVDPQGTALPGAAMGRAMAEAEDRRSLAEARENGWPIHTADGDLP